ncbi:MAG: GRAM domain-containing protein [archaeon]
MLIKKLNLRLNEKVLANVAANMFRDIEGVGGKLRVTNQRLLFEPHLLNLQNKPEAILLKDVKSASKRMTLLFIPNGMLVTMKSGKEHKFVLWSREKIIGLINEQIKNI